MATVIRPTDARKGRYVVWLCRCDCGAEFTADTRALKRGALRDCGCATNVRPGMVDLTGRRFGMLTCMELTGRRNSSGRPLWLCACDCGGVCETTLSQLRSGYRKSCGCLSAPKVKDWEGRRFGRLTVVSHAGREGGIHRWLCRCDCGRECIVGQPMLQSGKTRSCGCLRSEQAGLNAGRAEGSSAAVVRYYRENLSSANKSGHTGVYRNRRTGKWAAQITFQGRTRYLGSFAEFEDAVAARERAEGVFDEFLERCDRRLAEASHG